MSGSTALHCAALAGQQDVVRALLDEDTDVNAVNNYSQTSLAFAAANVPCNNSKNRREHQWSSGRIQRCHRCDPVDSRLMQLTLVCTHQPAIHSHNHTHCTSLMDVVVQWLHKLSQLTWPGVHFPTGAKHTRGEMSWSSGCISCRNRCDPSLISD